MKMCRMLTILLTVSCVIYSTARADIITNGSFESPDTPNFITISAGQTTIAPWVVGLTGVDLGDVNNGFIVGPAFDGMQYIDLDGTPGPGQLSQAFVSTPGLLYEVTFAYANNYVNQPLASATVRLFDSSGDRINQTINHSTSMAGNLNWSLFNGQFTAVENTTSFEITSLSGGGQGGILLDAVSIQIVPEPSTFSLGILALLPAVFFGQRKF